MSRAAFEIVEPTDGRDPWVRLVGENGEVLMHSESFQSGRQGALGNIEAVCRTFAIDAIADVMFVRGSVEVKVAEDAYVAVPVRQVTE